MMAIWLLLASTYVSDRVERELIERCGIEVPRHVRMSYAGDLWRIHYDRDLVTVGQRRCLEEWARNFETSGAVILWPEVRLQPPKPRSRHSN